MLKAKCSFHLKAIICITIMTHAVITKAINMIVWLRGTAKIIYLLFQTLKFSFTNMQTITFLKKHKHKPHFTDLQSKNPFLLHKIFKSILNYSVSAFLVYDVCAQFSAGLPTYAGDYRESCNNSPSFYQKKMLDADKFHPKYAAALTA